MATLSNTTNWLALGWGVIAGMRSMSAPAIASHYLSESPALLATELPLRLLQSKKVAGGFKVLAGTEIIADKLPGTPDRIALPMLLGRIASGALVGAAICQRNNQPKWPGTLLGGVGAVAASYGFYYLRTTLSKSAAVPDVVGALLEDALVLTVGVKLGNASVPKM